MCICVNCRHIHKCTTYLFIQQRHQNQVSKSSTIYNFIPKNTLIKINIVKKIDQIKFDWDLIECLSFTEQPGEWLYSSIFK